MFGRVGERVEAVDEVDDGCVSGPFCTDGIVKDVVWEAFDRYVVLSSL